MPNSRPKEFIRSILVNIYALISVKKALIFLVAVIFLITAYFTVKMIPFAEIFNFGMTKAGDLFRFIFSAKGLKIIIPIIIGLAIIAFTFYFGLRRIWQFIKSHWIVSGTCLICLVTAFIVYFLDPEWPKLNWTFLHANIFGNILAIIGCLVIIALIVKFGEFSFDLTGKTLKVVGVIIVIGAAVFSAFYLKGIREEIESRKTIHKTNNQPELADLSQRVKSLELNFQDLGSKVGQIENQESDNLSDEEFNILKKRVESLENDFQRLKISKTVVSNPAKSNPRSRESTRQRKTGTSTNRQIISAQTKNSKNASSITSGPKAPGTQATAMIRGPKAPKNQATAMIPGPKAPGTQATGIISGPKAP